MRKKEMDAEVERRKEEKGEGQRWQCKIKEFSGRKIKTTLRETEGKKYTVIIIIVIKQYKKMSDV